VAKQQRAKPQKVRQAYASVQDWMAATGTNQRQLARIVGVSEPHMSNILSKSRRCSYYLAVKLSAVTNVPISTLHEWPRKYGNPVELC